MALYCKVASLTGITQPVSGHLVLQGSSSSPLSKLQKGTPWTHKSSHSYPRGTSVIFSVESRFRCFKSPDRSQTWKKYIAGQYLCNLYPYSVIETQSLCMLLGNRSPFLLWLQCSLVFPSFLFDFFPWHLTEHWPWATARAVEGRSGGVRELPIGNWFTLTTVQDVQCDNHAQLLPWSRLGEKEQLLFHFLWRNKRLSNIPACKLLCKQNTASKASSKAPYIKKTQGELVAFSWSLHENVRGFSLSCSKKKFWRKNNQRNGHMCS